MKLKHVQVLNYKCFRDSGNVPIGETFTVIVGKNNSGKTVFLQSLSQSTFKVIPHRIPNQSTFAVQDPIVRARYSLRISGKELLSRFLSVGQQVLLEMNQPQDARVVTTKLHDIFSQSALSFDLERTANNGGVTSTVTPAYQTFASEPSRDFLVQISPMLDRQSWQIDGFMGGQETLSGFVAAYLEHSIYIFRAERMNVGSSPIDANPELRPDAGNLPSVLLQLPNNPAAHDQYIGLVREVFPTIYRVASVPTAPTTAQVTVFMSDSTHGAPRPGINVPLSESGTGISQVLAILYVAVTAPAPRIIVIDEPNSFLHPGAVKKLLSILAKLDHQYIISTHSSEIIKTIDPEFIHLVEWEGTEAKFHTVDRCDVHNQRRILSELGVSISDVFGAESVIWVEGSTEHLCFPLLLAHQDLSSPATVIVPLIATGDLEGRRRVRANLVWQAYEQLSKGSALIPPALTFSLDREGRTDAEMDDLRNRSSGAVRFLPRRTLENYLLNADAIATVLNDTVSCDTPISADLIAEWLKNKREQEAPGEGILLKVREMSWVRNADAPAILSQLFWDLAKVEYRKTTHSVELVRWLLKNKPAHLKELLAYVAGLVCDTQTVSS